MDSNRFLLYPSPWMIDCFLILERPSQSLSSIGKKQPLQNQDDKLPRLRRKAWSTGGFLVQVSYV